MSYTALSIDEIEISEQYDKEDDIYYVTVKTGEPSVVMEHDDRLLVEMGVFSKMPTGFRILNYTKHKDRAEAFREIFKRRYSELIFRKIKGDIKNRQRQLDRVFEKAIA